MIYQNYHKLLVANRGEIACRVIRSAHDMGISCVAIYVEADTNSPYVKMADEAVKISDSYLNSKEIIKAALDTGAEAIHPGYGFLSENAKFSREVLKAGLLWVGPSARVITSMGDKLKAKDLAEKAGVPTLPMTTDPRKAKEVGYPLLIKAAAGGGGKGMRIVNSAKELNESIKAAQREAKSSFGDDRIFIEKYVPVSRHIEIQILGDSHGNIVHLGERECSIQRRHQKIIEESPSPRVDPEMREAMGKAALKLAKKLKYESAGTIEFLVDDKSGEFWFLEVNTRLQVEHPVTEATTGIDIVHEQLRLARGEILGYDQEDIGWYGSAIEARLYAEDPTNDFLPATGSLIAYEPNPEVEARWDSGVEQGSIIGTDFDPMIAKVICYGENRIEAANKLSMALESLHIGGVVTNRDFLVSTLRSEAFLNGLTTTDFIEKVNPPRVFEPTENELIKAASVAAMWIQGKNHSEAELLGQLPSGWRNSRLPKQKINFLRGEIEIPITYRSRRDGKFDLNEESLVSIFNWDDHSISIEIDGHRITSKVSKLDNQIVVKMPWGNVSLEIVPRFVVPGAEEVTGGLIAPMPGKVVDLKVKVGDKVSKGDPVVILEAMKMEHQVNAPESGKVTKIYIKKDQQLDNGALLMIVDSK